jgi:flagellar motor switch protein FliN/FliY
VADDDLLDPSEIEALLKAAGGGGAPSSGPGDMGGASAPASSPAPMASMAEGDGSDLLSSNDIEALLRQRDEGLLGGMAAARAPSMPDLDANLERAERGVAAAMGDERPAATGPKRTTSNGAGASSFEFSQFELPGFEGVSELEIQALQEVELDLRIELGRAELLIEEVLQLREGSVVPLDKLAGDPVDILVNGRLVARGEVLVLNDNFCVRVAEILVPGF